MPGLLPGDGRAIRPWGWDLVPTDIRDFLMIRDSTFDVGMNNGDDTAHYLLEGFRMVAIKTAPDPG